ncbi:hypothetical protein GCM10009760_33410 [Kitasatospora kazusensis]|uniref:histidine kinase n=2 Tax=Kitasatospora kazusensis TaxID=407974 RepID=A0ABP5LFN2_9ACTN
MPDALWAALFLYLGLRAAVQGQDATGPQQVAHVSSALLLCGLALLRRHRPDAATGAVIALGFGQLLTGLDPDWTVSGPGCLLFAYTGAAFGSRRISRAALVGALTGGPLAVLLQDSGAHAAGLLADLLLFGPLLSAPFVLCWVWGHQARARRAHLAGLEERVRRGRAARAESVLAAERARIARELHDVVAHEVSAMVVQADGARYVMDKSPHRAEEALGTIASTGRQARAELRRALGLLPASGGDAERIRRR